MTTIEDIEKYFEVCGYDPEALISIGTRAGADGQIFFTTVKVADAPRQIMARQHVNCWIGACEIRQPEKAGSRGTADDVVRIPALWADLDVKPGGMQSYTVARRVIDDISLIIGRPVAIVASGHGLQPRWRYDGPVDAELVEGFGRLVKLVAEQLGGKVDSVYDLARIVRAPGTTNIKPDSEPKETGVRFFEGGPINAERLREVIEEYVPAPKIIEQAEERPPVETERGDRYVVAAINQIRDELEAIKTWPLGETDERGRGWEKICADAAFRLASLAKADWNGLTEEKARLAYFDAAPIDSGWTIHDVIKKWNSQWPRAEAADPPATSTDPLSPGFIGGADPFWWARGAGFQWIAVPKLSELPPMSPEQILQSAWLFAMERYRSWPQRYLLGAGTPSTSSGSPSGSSPSTA